MTAIRAKTTLTGHSKRVVEYLLAHPDQSRPAEIAGALGLSIAHTRDICLNLEKRGVVRRVPLHYAIAEGALAP